MIRILVYSVLLLTGMGASQFADVESWRPLLHAVTTVCLSYIMVEVGLEFSAGESWLKSYAVDCVIAATAAVSPWILCVLYLVGVLGTSWKEAWLVGLFAAPTSAGVLFTMLAAAGLSGTWVFKKARVLAVFDDLHTILLMIPLQIVFVGLKWPLLAVVILMMGLLVIAYRWLNRLYWPIGKSWLLLYGIAVTGLCGLTEHLTSVHLEVLLPAFVLGCLLNHRATIEEGDDPHSWVDQSVKALFMFLVGCSLPRVSMGATGLGMVLVHVAALTFLSNLGKCFPLLCYGREASRRERLALSVAMFPRGEVGAGVLLVALSYGLTGLPVALGSLSLALNLLMTGLLIMAVAKLIGRSAQAGGESAGSRLPNR